LTGPDAECNPNCNDADADGYHDQSCGGTDCDDNEVNVHPGSAESCSNTVDDNCDGDTDMEDSECDPDCNDSDDDGYHDQACGGTDCNDTHAADYPNAAENCDGRDNDCDGETDEEWPELNTPCSNNGCPEGLWVCAPNEADVVCNGPHPAEDDSVCDGLDEDCDGEADEDAVDRPCPLQAGVCAGAVETCLGLDGWSGCDYGPDYTEGLDETCDQIDEDCDGDTDEDAAVVLEPESGEWAGDGLDNNCNGLVDEAGGVMVPVTEMDGVWIDAYEIAVFENADCSGVRYGAADDDYPPGWPAAGTADTTLYACSLPGILPSGHLSWYRARRACEAQGKRLCQMVEWSSACNGYDNYTYPYAPSIIPGVCNDPYGGTGQPSATGSHPGCVNTYGAYDMSGNLAEWLREWDGNHDGNANVGGFHYACEVCSSGTNCGPCDDEPDTIDNVHEYLDCLPQTRDGESFIRDVPLAYLGTRCCYEEP
jgi:hypothetical protein